VRGLNKCNTRYNGCQHCKLVKQNDSQTYHFCVLAKAICTPQSTSHQNKDPIKTWEYNTFIRMMSRSSAPALESQISTWWLLYIEEQNIFRPSDYILYIYSSKMNKTSKEKKISKYIYIPYVQSQGADVAISKNPNTSRLRTDHTTLGIWDGDQPSSLVTKSACALLKIKLIHLRIQVIAQQ